MSEDRLPDDIVAFIAKYLDSVVQLELLILLHSRRDRSWTPDDIARQLRIDPRWTASELDRLSAHGFVSTLGDSTPTFRYAAPPELDRSVARVVETYRERRLSVINCIYSRASDAIRSFADAFRLRKE